MEIHIRAGETIEDSRVHVRCMLDT